MNMYVCGHVCMNLCVCVCVCVCRYGQLSGMVEPVAGLAGTVAVVVSEFFLEWSYSKLYHSN